MTLNRFMFILFCLAIAFGLYSIWSTPVFYLDSTDWGLVSRFPITFWIGLSVMCVFCFLLSSKSDLQPKHAVLIPALVLFYLHIVPLLIERPVGLSGRSLWPSSEANLVISSGHVPYGTGRGLTTYESWPFFTVFNAVFMTVTNIPLLSLAKYFPLFSLTFWGILVFLVLRNFVKSTYALIAVAWFLSGLWAHQQYFGPPSLGFTMFLMFVWLFVEILFGDHKTQARVFFPLALIIFVALVFTHALSSIFLILVLSVFSLATRIFSSLRGKTSVRAHAHSLTTIMCLYCLSVFLGHSIFFAPNFFGYAITEKAPDVQELLTLPIFREAERIGGSYFQQLTNTSIYVLILMNIVISAIAIFHIFRKKTMDRHRLTFWLSFVGALLLPATMLRYGAEAPYRAFMFGLMASSLLSVYLLKGRGARRILISAILVLLILGIPALYGKESYRIVTATEFLGGKHTAMYLPDNTTVLYGVYATSYIKHFDPTKRIELEELGGPPYYFELNTSVVEEKMNEAQYIVISRMQDNYYAYYLGGSPFDKMNASTIERLNRIYENGHFLLITQLTQEK